MKLPKLHRTTPKRSWLTLLGVLLGSSLLAFLLAVYSIKGPPLQLRHLLVSASPGEGALRRPWTSVAQESRAHASGRFVRPAAVRRPPASEWLEVRYTSPANITPGLPMRLKRFWLEAVGGMPPPAYWSPKMDALPPLVFVTGVSSNHFHESLAAVASVQHVFPKHKIVYYDLGLSTSLVNKVRSMCSVEYRRANFAAFPAYVRDLRQYRWKPILIQKSLTEFGAILWMDSSVRIVSNGSRIYDDVMRQASESGVVMLSKTRTSIYSVTNPKMFDYLPIDLNSAKSVYMFQAGAALYVNTREAYEGLLKWYVFCALDKNCMAPPGSNLYCNFRGRSAMTQHGNCHRYDQSAINTLLLNHFNTSRPYETDKNFLVVARDSSAKSIVRYCNSTNYN